jgi:hypothetical protein
MTPTCIAFELQENDEIKILTVNTPYTAMQTAIGHFRENLSAQTSSLSHIKPPCKEIKPEGIIVKDVSHLAWEDQQILNNIKTLTELETICKKTKRNKSLDFTDANLTPRLNESLDAIKEKGHINIREIYHIIIPKLIGKI